MRVCQDHHRYACADPGRSELRLPCPCGDGRAASVRREAEGSVCRKRECSPRAGHECDADPKNAGDHSVWGSGYLGDRRASGKPSADQELRGGYRLSEDGVYIYEETGIGGAAVLCDLSYGRRERDSGGGECHRLCVHASG